MRNFSCFFKVLLLIFIMESCTGPKDDSSREVIVEGRIAPILVRNKKIYFYRAKDSLNLFFAKKTITDSVNIDKDGNFKFIISDWTKPGFFDLGMKDVIFAANYFLQPGDKINLVFEGNELPPKLHVSKEIGKYNYFLQVFYDSFYRSPEVKKFYYVISNFMFAPDYADYINKRRIEQLAYFNNYFKNESVDSIFRFYFESELNYNWANDKLYFLWKKRIRKEVRAVDTSYFDFLKIVPSDNPAALNCPGYTRFINLYIRELYQEKFFAPSKDFSVSIEKCKLALEKLKGLDLKIALCNILMDEMTNADNEKRVIRNDAVINTLLDMALRSTGDSSYYYFVFKK